MYILEQVPASGVEETLCRHTHGHREVIALVDKKASKLGQ